MSDHIPLALALGVATPGGAWRVEHLTLWFPPPPPTDHDTLEAEAIAAWVADNPRSEAVHVWLMDEDGWAEDDDDEVTAMRERRRRDALDAPDDLPD